MRDGSAGGGGSFAQHVRLRARGRFLLERDAVFQLLEAPLALGEYGGGLGDGVAEGDGRFGERLHEGTCGSGNSSSGVRVSCSVLDP